jgi:ATP-dependent Clp protease ATP-binding subunit ClpA
MRRGGSERLEAASARSCATGSGPPTRAAGRELPSERELKEEEAKAQAAAAGGRRLIKEEVDQEDIAEIVSRWTGKLAQAQVSR